MPSKIFKTWQERIDSGVFTQGQCNQFAGNITRALYGEEPQGKRSALTDPERCDLYDKLRKQGVKLTDQHTAIGLDWLRKYGKKVLDLPDDVLPNFSHFMFFGEVNIEGRSCVPVWRIVLTDGRAIDYYNLAWQSGSDQGWHWVLQGAVKP